MEYIKLFMLNMKTSSWLFKCLGLGLAWFAPIQMSLLTMLILIMVDMVVKLWALKKTKEKIRFSRLVRGTGNKLTAYLMAILSLFLFQSTFFLSGMWDFTTLLVGLLCAGEVSSIFNNMFIITKNKLFLIIKDKVDSWVKKQIK